MNRNLIISILLLGVLAEISTAEADGSTENPPVGSKEELVQKIEDIINNPRGHFHNNTECEELVDELKLIKNIENVTILETFYNKFQNYNSIRLQLEDNIEKFAKELGSKINLAASLECIRFYFNQKTKIEAALKDTNCQKEIILRENSIPCPNYNYDSNYDEDHDAYYN